MFSILISKFIETGVYKQTVKFDLKDFFFNYIIVFASLFPTLVQII